jgi:hypothetical protein
MLFEHPLMVFFYFQKWRACALYEWWLSIPLSHFSLPRSDAAIPFSRPVLTKGSLSNLVPPDPVSFRLSFYGAKSQI